VFFRKPGELWARRRDWAERFAEALGLEAGAQPVFTPGATRSFASLLLAAFAALLAVVLHRFHHPPLRVLNLAGNPISAAGAAELIASPWMQQLEQLEIDRELLGDEATETLVKAFGNRVVFPRYR
jgi:hypothetical protein